MKAKVIIEDSKTYIYEKFDNVTEDEIKANLNNS